MDIDDFLKDKAGFYSVESGFAVWEVKNSEFLHNIEIRFLFQIFFNGSETNQCTFNVFNDCIY